jgi:hypothetical protein
MQGFAGARMLPEAGFVLGFQTDVVVRGDESLNLGSVGAG